MCIRDRLTPFLILSTWQAQNRTPWLVMNGIDVYKRQKLLAAALALAVTPLVACVLWVVWLIAHDELLGISYTKELGRAVMAQPMPEGVTLCLSLIHI